ncbi:signal peptidase I [Anaeromassilibacillus sp. An172]|uniref:signal peptidase I n=1 Tax=Anaeromassilibacillus sp. An172 TaxID=1965570 RepID=UPI000B38919F|nr:signal peptidase I [Anaeromassilibacillus sp. An172]OUP79584.1 signal peptidase I [Anaeromassilibacillus sp. An172]
MKKSKKNDEIYSTIEPLDNSGVAGVYDILRSVLISASILILIITFVFTMVIVDGRSMQHTLESGDKIIVTKMGYQPKDGDVIVVGKSEDGYSKPIVKRVIATEGQTLEIDFENQQVIVDGKVLDEPYISSETIEGTAEIPEVIPEGYVFVMGDNRYISMDSRYKDIGLVNVDDIVGKAVFVVFPFDRFGFIE